MTIPWLRLLAFFFAGFIFIVPARHAYAVPDAELTSTTVIARVGPREIHYGQVRVDPENFATLKRMGYGAGMLDALRRTQESSNLMALFEQQVLSETLARQPIDLAPTEEQVETRTARLFKEMFGRETFTQKDADRHNQNLTGVIRLLETWQASRAKGEALFKKEFADKISPHEWGLLKKRYTRPEHLEKLRVQTPHITVDEQTEGIRRMAVTQLRQEKLLKGLVAAGEFESERDYDAWLLRKMKERATILHPRFAWRELPQPTPTPEPAKSRISKITAKLRKKKKSN